MLLFPGDRLHGVCPSAPNATRGADAPREQRHGRAAPLRTAAQLPRRVTLMLGFWTRDVSRLGLEPAAQLPRSHQLARVALSLALSLALLASQASSVSRLASRLGRSRGCCRVHRSPRAARCRAPRAT